MFTVSKYLTRLRLFQRQIHIMHFSIIHIHGRVNIAKWFSLHIRMKFIPRSDIKVESEP